ncbi:MAG: 6-phospho-3-hexuloisomerase [Saccharofermentanales bacterium]|jgi:6-phospho-3-hexuloisomerase
MSKYKEIVQTVVCEHERVLMAVDPAELEILMDMICEAKCIQVFGMGRMKCAVRAFVMRLMHMGFDAHVVYDTTCPNIGQGDLLIVNCACTGVSYYVMELAKKNGASIAAITAHPESKWGALCDHTVRLSGQVNPGKDGEIASIQPMAALFEQTVFVLEDIIIMMLMEKKNITADQMAKRHTNLDGYMEMNEDSD